jgi:hypothetical protein
MNTYNTSEKDLQNLINREWFLESNEYRVEEHCSHSYLFFTPLNQNDWVKNHGTHMKQTIEQWLNKNYHLTIEQWENRNN